MTKRRGSIPWFFIGLGLYTLALLTAIAVGLNWVSEQLTAYEAGLPDKAAEAVYQQYFAGGLEQAAAVSGGNVGPYETHDHYVATVKEAVGQEPLRYFETPTADQKNHAYTVAAGKVRVGEFLLVPAEEEGKWVLQELTLSVKPEQKVTVTVWQGSRVFLNGVEVEETLAVPSGEEQDHPSYEHLSLGEAEERLASSPITVTYTLEGLYQIPEVTVKDRNGNPCEVTEKNGVYLAAFAYDDHRAEEVRAAVFKPMEEYCKFMHRDAEYADLAAYIDRNGDFYRNLKRATTEWNRAIVDFEFDTEELSELYFYSDDVFSCLVHVEESVLGRGKRDWYTYVVDCRAYFRRSGNGWLLYDMDFSMA